MLIELHIDAQAKANVADIVMSIWPQLFPTNHDEAISSFASDIRGCGIATLALTSLQSPLQKPRSPYELSAATHAAANRGSSELRRMYVRCPLNLSRSNQGAALCWDSSRRGAPKTSLIRAVRARVKRHQ